ncbi:exosortase/archaeosortase family protein [Paludisphaera rhizosphaerae]|uniref:exosortase/archaeosortase family protein n=1 Tax=Paludisphaera rhizosphaerae TaxID=2711216 RepID=UPI002106CE55|nr:exosortase/archaeosortase family protein [Paludisphaera rhizosphaerae]
MLVFGAWFWWPVLSGMAARWSEDPRYSHGYLVAPFACYLLWIRRERLEAPPTRPTSWGLIPLAAGVASQIAGAYLFQPWLEAVAILPILAGLALLVGGTRVLDWTWPAIAFLVFMIPLPYRIEVALGAPLQGVATEASTYALQTLGQPAFAEGFVIHLGTHRIGVVEACNGLGMLYMFLGFATGAALLLARPTVDRVLILLSAAPIALAANVIRITVTGLLHQVAGSRWAEYFYHDFAGWLMMPLALLMLRAEVAALDHLFTPIEPVSSHVDPRIVLIRNGGDSRRVPAPGPGRA